MKITQSLFSPWRYPVTLLFLLLNLAVFGIQALNGVSPSDPSPSDLIAWGGNLPALTLTGDYWRLATSIFLHGGWLHLLANMYMLLMIGLPAEQRFGASGLTVIYLCGGLFASLVSAVWGSSGTFVNQMQLTPFGIINTPGIKLIVAVGASGALMAVCGALLASTVNASLAGESDEESGAIKSGLVQVILINLLLGFQIEGIDQAAHVGGLLGGLILGLSVGQPVHEQMDLWRGLRLLAHALILPGLFWLYLQGTPDEGLLEVRNELQAEADEAVRQEEAEKAEKRALRLAARERASLPEPVPDDQAAGRVIRVGESASAMALSDDEKTAYVTDYRTNSLAVVDLASGEVRQMIAGPKSPAGKADCHQFMCAGVGVANLALLPQRRLALLPSMLPNALAVVDLDSGKLVRSLPLGRFPRSILLDKGQTRAYVHNLRDNSVSVVDLENWQVLKTWKLNQPDYSSPERPQAMWLSADQRKLFVTDRPYRQVEIFDTATLEPLTHEIPDTWFEQIEPPEEGRDAVHALSAERLLEVGNDRLAIRKTWEFCESRPEPWVFATRRDAGGRHLLAVYRRGEAMVQLSNLDTLVTLGEYPVPDEVQHLQISRDGQRIFALGAGGQLAILDLSQRKKDESEWELLCRPRPEAR